MEVQLGMMNGVGTVLKFLWVERIIWLRYMISGLVLGKLSSGKSKAREKESDLLNPINVLTLKRYSDADKPFHRLQGFTFNDSSY